MKEISNDNILELINDYYTSIGLKNEASNYFTSSNFKTALILKLPNVCLVQRNKSTTSRSHQSHIHVTGTNRLFFYTSEQLNSTSSSTEHIKRHIMVSQANIKNLNDKNITSFDSLNIIKSTTHSKIECRKSGGDSQVQISNLRLDDKNFIDLRNGLYLDDLLIFLKFRKDSADEFFALGIPNNFYSNKYTISRNLFLEHVEDSSVVNLKDAIKIISDNTNPESIVSNSDFIEDEIYQNLVNEEKTAKAITPTYQPKKYTAKKNKKTNSNNRPQTNPKLGHDAILLNNYKCFFASDKEKHTTFLKPNNETYMEAHHIIPLKFQNIFENELDTLANIVPLCPTCHRKIHYGTKEEINQMLSTLYESRKDLLIKSGLNISLDELLSFY